MANAMRRMKDGTYKWVAADWWHRLKTAGCARRLNVLLVKVGTKQHIHYKDMMKFIDYLIRNGDHDAAWRAAGIRHKASVGNLYVCDAKYSVERLVSIPPARDQQRLEAVRRILSEKDDSPRTFDLLRSIVGVNEKEGEGGGDD